MNIKILPGLNGGKIDAIPSKSHAHRMIICAAFADRPTELMLNGSSDDIETTLGCVKALGCAVEKKSGSLVIRPAAGISAVPVLDCGESGSTYRFMLPVTAALGIDAEFLLKGRLPERPMGPLFEILSENGVRIDTERPGSVSVSGKFECGSVSIRGNVSSQFITGIMLAAPVMRKKITINIEGPLASSGYVDITADIMRMFGVNAVLNGNTITVDGEKGYISPGKAAVEGDWSNTAYILAMCLAGSKDIKVDGINAGSVHGDMEICSILRSFGLEPEISGSSIYVKAGPVCPCEIDAGNIPDLVPAVAALACGAEGKTVIKNISRLKLKESDRILSVTQGLRTAGADISSDGENITVNGTGNLEGGTIDSFSDHRIVMMAAIAAQLSERGVTVKHAEAVSKSYPAFFDDAKKLGTKIIAEE